MDQFARNHWYVGAWSSELLEAPLSRRILGEPVVFFRRADGTAAALIDRCPHRLVPLSLGTCVDGHLRCGYHGMEFDGDGRCVRIPAQKVIPPNAHTRHFPVTERYGMVWIWMGEPARANAHALPRVEHYAEPGWDRLEGGYQYHPSNYRNIIENLMDPAHTTFVHKNTIGNPLAGEQPVTTEKTDEYIVAYRWIENSQPTAHDRLRLNIGDIAVDRGQYFYFYLPATSRVETIVQPAGTPRGAQHAGKGLHTYSYKFLTPESASATHFFWLHIRNYMTGDAQAGERLRSALEQTFAEDLVIEAAMQRSQEETGARQQVALEIDRAPMMALRMLERMIAAEQHGEPVHERPAARLRAGSHLGVG
jgi:phenylpropionate dioxygenase-like ring-hydroxylating dioxygenase large terminal subunit